jgi:hypothetical protein
MEAEGGTMKARRLLPPAILALLIAPGAAGAEGLAGRFSIAVQAGTQSEISGDIIGASQGTLLGKPVVTLAQRYRDLYRPDLRLQGLLAYGVATHVELFARGSYYKAKEAGIEAGTFDGKTMFTFFDQYREVGGELGLRYYFAPQSRLKSYFGPVVGLRHVDEVLVDLSVPDAGSALLNVPFTKAGNVFVFGLDLGFTFDVTPTFYVGVDTGLRYQAAPDGFASFPDLSGFEANESRWTAPVSATLGLRF